MLSDDEYSQQRTSALQRILESEARHKLIVAGPGYRLQLRNRVYLKTMPSKFELLISVLITGRNLALSQAGPHSVGA